MNVRMIMLIFVIGASHAAACAKKKRNQSNREQRNSSMVFNKNIVELAKSNTFYRKELVTGPHSQLVLMSIPVGEEIGMEVHQVDQTLIFVQGHGQAIVNGEVSDVFPNHLVFVPAGSQHNFKNSGQEELKLFTIYAPAQHKSGTVEKTKSEE